MMQKLPTAQQLNGFTRNYVPESEHKTIDEEKKRAARVRRRIEDIKQASALESEIINEVWG